LKELIQQQIEEHGQSQIENKNSNECDIIALTSFTDKLMRDKSFKCGMKEVVNKPISKKELMRLVLMYHFKLTF